MFPRPSPWLAFLFIILGIAALTLIGPEERSLGASVRLVYLHGSWVWTSLIGFAAAALAGALGLLRRNDITMRWSIALGQAGTLFWLTYLPISLWTMQLNWNGLFLDEPRWRVAIDFAIVAILIQGAIILLRRHRLASWLNMGFVVVLVFSLLNAEQVMHPSSPIASSPSAIIKLYFITLLVLCLAAGWFFARWRYQKIA